MAVRRKYKSPAGTTCGRQTLQVSEMRHGNGPGRRNFNITADVEVTFALSAGAAEGMIVGVIEFWRSKAAGYESRRDQQELAILHRLIRIQGL
jgi:hypothetical protein